VDGTAEEHLRIGALEDAGDAGAPLELLLDDRPDGLMSSLGILDLLLPKLGVPLPAIVSDTVYIYIYIYIIYIQDIVGLWARAGLCIMCLCLSVYYFGVALVLGSCIQLVTTVITVESGRKFLRLRRPGGPTNQA